MIDWDDEPLPLEELHAEAALIALRCEIRDAEVRLECLRWWAANPERLQAVVDIARRVTLA